MWPRGDFSVAFVAIALRQAQGDIGISTCDVVSIVSRRRRSSLDKLGMTETKDPRS
jgi:hypothetical protein